MCLKWFNLIYLMLTSLPTIWKSVRTMKQTIWNTIQGKWMTLQDFQLATEGTSQASETKIPQNQKELSVKASETQVAGDHYKKFVIQPFEYCYKNNLNNLQSEAISYISRYRYKWENDKDKQVVDLQKAIHTLELLIEEING